jgi:hypothetical protein
MSFIQKIGDPAAKARASSNGLDIQRLEHALRPMDWSSNGQSMRFVQWIGGPEAGA